MNIRVNAIAPGPIDTEAARNVVPDVFIEQIVGGAGPQAPGHAGRPGRHVPVPPLRRRLVDDRPHLQRGRRPGHSGHERTGGSSVEDDAGVRLIAFDRPEVRNAFDSAMYRAVTEALVASLGPTTRWGRWC